jgi:ATP-dependent protease HslVU (ClpYQ) peptidase subunit
MTVIVAALTKDQGVVMAADRLVSAGWEKQYHQAPKLWTTEQFALGAAGDLRAAQVLKHHVTWPKYRPDEDTDLEKWLVKTLFPAVRAGTKDQGVVKNDSGVETLEAGFLWATADLLAEVAGNGCVTVATSGRMAIGSGSAEALGRLGDTGPWTEADVVDAARRAIQSNRGCDGPISIVDTKTLTVRTVEEDPHA